MVCLSPVAEGQELVSIPRKLLMTAETARQAAECGRLVQETGLTEWQVHQAGGRRGGRGEGYGEVVLHMIDDGCVGVLQRSPGCEGGDGGRGRTQVSWECW